MHIKRVSAIGDSCNFCRRGKIADSGTKMDFPYKEVYSIESEGSGGVHVRMCDDCLIELKEKTK